MRCEQKCDKVWKFNTVAFRTPQGSNVFSCNSLNYVDEFLFMFLYKSYRNFVVQKYKLYLIRAFYWWKVLCIFIVI